MEIQQGTRNYLRNADRSHTGSHHSTLFLVNQTKLNSNIFVNLQLNKKIHSARPGWWWASLCLRHPPLCASTECSCRPWSVPQEGAKYECKNGGTVVSTLRHRSPRHFTAPSDYRRPHSPLGLILSSHSDGAWNIREPHHKSHRNKARYYHTLSVPAGINANL